jgi:hypothetical protein
MANLSRSLYKAARIVRWGEVLGRAAAGNPKPLAKRIRNKFYFRMFGRFLR